MDEVKVGYKKVYHKTLIENGKPISRSFGGYRNLYRWILGGGESGCWNLFRRTQPVLPEITIVFVKGHLCGDLWKWNGRQSSKNVVNLAFHCRNYTPPGIRWGNKSRNLSWRNISNDTGRLDEISKETLGITSGMNTSAAVSTLWIFTRMITRIDYIFWTRKSILKIFSLIGWKWNENPLKLWHVIKNAR